MADDLEAFLRQAAQRRAQKAAGAQPQAAPPRPAPAAPPRTPSPPQARRPVARPTPPPPARPEVIDAEIVSAEPASRLKTTVDTSKIARHTKQLGEEVGLADEHMAAHLSQTFDHQVGSQVSEPATPARPAAATFDSALDVEALLDMLTKPTSVRNAIVLTEILRRPDFD